MVRVRFTGEVITTDGYMVGITFKQGHSDYARPGMGFPVIAAMNEDWFNTYGKLYWGLVEQEAETLDYYLLGIVPVDGKSPTTQEGYDQNYMMISHYMRLWLNDSGKKFIVDLLDDNAKILLGNKDVTSPAVLGDINEQVLTLLVQLHQQMYDGLESAIPVAQDGGANLKTTWLGALSTFMDTINQLTGSAQNIPNIKNTKSQTVKLK